MLRGDNVPGWDQAPGRVQLLTGGKSGTQPKLPEKVPTEKTRKRLESPAPWSAQPRFLPCRCGCHVGNQANPAEEATLLLGAPSKYLD